MALHPSRLTYHSRDETSYLQDHENLEVVIDPEEDIRIILGLDDGKWDVGTQAVTCSVPESNEERAVTPAAASLDSDACLRSPSELPDEVITTRTQTEEMSPWIELSVTKDSISKFRLDSPHTEDSVSFVDKGRNVTTGN